MRNRLLQKFSCLSCHRNRPGQAKYTIPRNRRWLRRMLQPSPSRPVPGRRRWSARPLRNRSRRSAAGRDAIGQAAADEIPAIAELQVIAPDADSEIVEIFIEEAGEVLDGLAVDIPAWIANPDDRELLAEIRRAFHTIKGSGRMVGAMAAGELAWAFENLVNRVIENTVPASPAVLDLLGQAMPALRDLVAQVSNPDTILLTDISVLGSRAVHLSKPGAHDDEPGHVAEAVVDQRAHDAGTGTPDAAIMSVQDHTGRRGVC